MRLVMTLLVRDEADVLAANIEHHLAQGVDHVIVTDNLSQDETPDIVRGYERDGVATLLLETDDDYDQATWVTRMARLSAREHGADWVINNDADEFWYAPGTTLAAHLAAQPPSVTVLDAPRHDLLPRPPAAAPWHERLVYRYREPLRFDGTELQSKVCHRADPDVEVIQGNHAVSGPLLGEPSDTGLHILHAPIRGHEQFRRKVAVGGAAYNRNTRVGPKTGHVWRELAARVEDGTFDAWWDERVIELDELTALVLADRVIVDHRVRDAVRAVR